MHFDRFIPMYLSYIALMLISFNSRVVINEVMANPNGSTGPGKPEDRNEFVELYNISNETVNLAGWRITDFDATDSMIAWTDTILNIKYPEVITNTTYLPPNQFVLILDPEYTMAEPLEGYVQPYDFPAGVLILTIGNTTIGNELQNNDPILLYSPDLAESTSFGTPFDTTDTLPYDAGNGFSWERITFDVPDSARNWKPSIDPSGSTPGRENSIFSFQDLTINNFFPLPMPSETIGINLLVEVFNKGYQDAQNWNVTIYNDLNHNKKEETGERIGLLQGNLLKAQIDTTLQCQWHDPPERNNEVWAIVNYSHDQDTTNNKMMTYVNKTTSREFMQIPLNRFSPDQDGFEDSLMLRYEVPEAGGKLTISVFDLKGKEIATILQTKLKEKIGIASWDGKSRAGKNMPIGIYIIKFEYKIGSKLYEEKKSVILAKKL
jgi:hypothetical protein